jgi:hypothetical protein
MVVQNHVFRTGFPELGLFRAVENKNEGVWNSQHGGTVRVRNTNSR